MSAVCTVLACAVLLMGLPVQAAPPGRQGDPRDVQITLYIRRALAKDPELATQNLFVGVRYGEATLSGPLPTWELAERALKIAQKVPGVYFVRNELHVGGKAEEALRGLLRGLAEAGGGELFPVVELPGVESPGGGNLGGRTSIFPDPFPLGKAQEVYNAHPSLPPSPGSGVHLLSPVELEERPAPRLAPGVTLLRPRSAPVRETPPRSVPAAPAAPPGLLTAVESLRQDDHRFRALRIEVEQGVVVLSGRVADTEHLIELARAIARLPGVVRVDLHAVQTR